MPEPIGDCGIDKKEHLTAEIYELMRRLAELNGVDPIAEFERLLQRFRIERIVEHPFH